MNRRQLLQASVAGGVLVALGGGYAWLHNGLDRENLTIAAALLKLDALSGKPVASGEWTPYQIFSHAAQSVEYSMSGFPEQKSRLFKNTAGYVAFSIFYTRGSMTHGLSEPIPGAPTLTAQGSTEQAVARLRQAMIDFQQYQGELQPHFAYGPLSKEQYEVAHVIHLNNHLVEISR